jgi:hypothetical protein
MKHRNAFFVLLAAAALAGCAAHSTSSLVPQPNQGIPAFTPPNAALVPDAGPRPCAGQKTYAQYASDDETLLTTGGSLCIPAFGGLGGSIKYPPANPATTISLITSTTNYNGKLPSLHTGTPIVYIQLAIAGSTTFGQKAKAGGGLTGAAIVPGDTYTAYAQAKIYGFKYNFKPCYAVATQGKYGGVLGGVGSLLNGQKVPANTSGVIEIYPGQSAGTKC